jgi:hypothetical protein
MSAADVVSILQVGLSGLAFLLALLSYRIISREQAKPEPRSNVLRSARLYFYQCIVLAIVVAGFQLFNALALRPGAEEIAACNDSALLLEDINRRSGATVLAVDVDRHLQRCMPILRWLDRVH